MDTYLLENLKYWTKGYNAPNVESYIFRLAGRILKPEFNLPRNNERLLDFGCGQGAAVEYFNKIGFDAKGCDISETDINIGKIRYPHLQDRLITCPPNPTENPFYGWNDDISVVVGAQSFYYFSKQHFHVLMEKLHSSMRKGGLIFATMIGEQHTYFNHSTPTDDEWLRVINFKGRRIHMENYYSFFVKDEADIREKFSMFSPIHVGHYSMQLEENETNNFHWVFLGQKT